MATEENISHFFSFYNISWFHYRQQEYFFYSQKLQAVISNSGDKCAVKTAQQYLVAVQDQKQISLRYQANLKKVILDFDLSGVDETKYNNTSDEQLNVEDIMLHIGGSFDNIPFTMKKIFLDEIGTRIRLAC